MPRCCSLENRSLPGLCVKSALCHWHLKKSHVKARYFSRVVYRSNEAKKRLHVRLPSGEIRVGVDAFLALWAEMPGYRILGRVIACPGIYHGACLVYDRVLAPVLYWWDQRRMRSHQDQRTGDE
jgi:Protein of unknown function, DUF393.